MENLEWIFQSVAEDRDLPLRLRSLFHFKIESWQDDRNRSSVSLFDNEIASKEIVEYLFAKAPDGWSPCARPHAVRRITCRTHPRPRSDANLPQSFGGGRVHCVVPPQRSALPSRHHGGFFGGACSPSCALQSGAQATPNVRSPQWCDGCCHARLRIDCPHH